LAEEKKHEQCWIDRSNLFSSFLFILEKKGTRKKRKEKPNKQTLVLKTSTVSTYKIKVRNKQQGTRMPPTKMFVNE
jgi:hypothetical protein